MLYLVIYAITYIYTVQKLAVNMIFYLFILLFKSLMLTKVAFIWSKIQ